MIATAERTRPRKCSAQPKFRRSLRRNSNRLQREGMERQHCSSMAAETRALLSALWLSVDC